MVSKILLACTALSAGLLVFGAVAIVVLNTFLFEPTVTWFAGKVSERSGIEIAFDEAQGSLLSGKLELTGLQIERRNTSKAEYELSAEKVALDVDVLSLALGTASLSMLAVDGASGEFWSKPKPPGTASPGAPRKNFEIAQLSLSNISIGLNRPNAARASLTIDEMVSAPFRSRYAVFDVFFRSNIVASIDGYPVVISTDRGGDGQKTKWVLKDLPAASVRHYVDKAPFSWFEQGTVDVVVDDDWKTGDTPEIDLDWRIVLKRVKVAPPENTGVIQRTISAPVTKYINARQDDIDLRFRTVMNKQQFMNKSSLDATGLWGAVLEGTARAIAERTELKSDEVKSKVKNTLDRVKDYLDKRRSKDAGQ